jgi:RNA polymerase sigma factor (sigma-70 family)
MPEMDEIELLAQYARHNSETAFTTLVERYVNLVYSTALRRVGNPQAAEEIAQAVFIILARKARGLSRRTVLSGWLFQTTRLTAANFLRGEIRRQKREQEAYMQSILNEPEPEIWPHISPLLDDAMGRLGERDRNAIVLRFFENKSLADLGEALGASEDAAKMRVNRALDKLHRYFNKRGVSSTTAIIGGAVSVNSVHAAPAGLAKTISAVAFVKGSIATASILTLVKGTMKTMTWLKLKFAAGVGVSALLAGGVATVAISQTSSDDKLAQEIAAKSRDAYAALSCYSDSGTVVFEMGSQTITTTFNIRLQRPNLYRIDWIQTTGLYTNQGAVWSDGSGNNLQIAAPDYLMLAARQKQNPKPQKMPNMKTALAMATPLSSFAASTIPGSFFNQNLGDFFAPAASGRYPLKKEQDATIGDVDCYVVSSAMIDLSKLPDIGKPGTVSTMFWIGKKDFLIHQCRMKYVEKADTSDQAIDEAIKKSLKIQNKPATPETVAAMRPQMKAIMEQLKSGFESGVVSTQTHENIVVNQKLSPADFAP